MTVMNALPLTRELAARLGEKAEVLVDVPMKAMDTIHYDGNVLVVYPCNDVHYSVEVLTNSGKKRKMAVCTEEHAANTPYPSPKKFLETARIAI